MAQYLNLDEFFDDDTYEKEMKANEAIAFGKWIANSTYLNMSCGKWWYPAKEKFYTTEELYNKFKNITNEVQSGR